MCANLYLVHSMAGVSFITSLASIQSVSGRMDAVSSVSISLRKSLLDAVDI